jgi:hypothetical protein
MSAGIEGSVSSSQDHPPAEITEPWLPCALSTGSGRSGAAPGGALGCGTSLTGSIPFGLYVTSIIIACGLLILPAKRPAKPADGRV